MGQHGFQNLPRSDPLGVDFLQVTETLNTSSRRVSLEIMRLGIIRLVSKEIMGFAKVFGDNAQCRGM
jgi:hypothetical protein